MAAIAAQSASVLGTDLTFSTAAGGGDTFQPGSCVIVKNGSGSSITVTVAVPNNTKYGIANPDYTKAVAAGASTLFANLPQDLADPSDARVHVTYSSATTVTVASFNA